MVSETEITPTDLLEKTPLAANEERARERAVDNLPETRPYPLLHYTRPSVAARAMMEGLTSIDAARESGHHISNRNNWQGTGAISVTDLEGYAQDAEEAHHVDPKNISKIAEEALGMSEGHSRFWYKGGVCLLINPGLKRYYGGRGTVASDDINEAMLGQGEYGKSDRYGGGFSAEAVVPDHIAAEDIHGVMLSSFFSDADMVEAFAEKAASLKADSLNDYITTFGDEINLLGLFGLLDDELKQGLDYIRRHHEAASKLDFAVNDPFSFPNLADPEGYKRKKQELETMLSDSEFHKYADTLLKAGDKLVDTLRESGISTYSELIIFLAKTQGIPVYDKESKVIWPSDE